jgi:oxalate decarboxylase/phosphoglucose isomerase-like protein (cupin superfamily)
MTAPAHILRPSDARVFLEGPELCREYVRTPKLWFGTSTLLPGQRGAIDPGHAEAEEVFYCCQGHVLVFDEQCYYELHAGDALHIPPGLPHTIINVGETTAVIAWAGAPGA